MNEKNIALILAAALLLGGCKNSGDDPLPVQPNPPVVNLPPTANAGADQLVLTGSAVSLNGSGTDSDGTATLAWAQTSGTAVTLTGASSGTPAFTAPGAAATLVFSLTVTDNSGAVRNDSVTVEVNAAPVANAGSDQAVVMGASVALNGSGADANGTIASYAWSQTSGTAVTLTGSTTAAPTFTAPASVGMLQFQLTVTDNQGATHADSVDVSVSSLAAPVIVRSPANVVAFEHGIALLFVVASGENLTYDWRYSSGAPWASGPEPYMVRGRGGGLQTSSDGQCFYVIVSNAAGSATSEEGCLTVVDIKGSSDPSDDNDEDNHSLAEAFGNSMLAISFQATGPLTGGGVTANRSMVPHLLGPGRTCLGGGRYVGATLDGQALTQVSALPLGQHTITEIWEDCHNGDPDEPTLRSGGVMISYDFPTTFGVGSYTMYLSGNGEYPEFSVGAGVMNGILQVTNARSTGAGGWPTDEIEILLDDDFCAAALRLSPSLLANSIEITRRLNMAENVVTDATLDFSLALDAFEDDGFNGTIHEGSNSSSDIEFHFNPDAGDGEESHTSEGEINVWLDGQNGNWYLGRIVAGPGNGDWVFHDEEPPGPQFPGDGN